jgi:hypothetical protein
MSAHLTNNSVCACFASWKIFESGDRSRDIGNLAVFRIFRSLTAGTSTTLPVQAGTRSFPACNYRRVSSSFQLDPLGRARPSPRSFPLRTLPGNRRRADARASRLNFDGRQRCSFGLELAGPYMFLLIAVAAGGSRGDSCG